MSKELVLDDLPRARFDPSDHEGMSLKAGPWRGRITAKTDEPYLRCGVKLGVELPTDYDQRNDMCWTLRIERERKSISNGAQRRTVRGAFVVKLQAPSDGHGINSGVAHEATVMVGMCRSWEDAIEQAAFAPIIPTLRTFGHKIYGDRDTWSLIRPFEVVYPFKVWDEPNAQYSPFRYKGGRFDIVSEGATMAMLDARPSDARQVASDAGANAYLWGPINGEYRLYHRSNMQSYDVIDLDSWYARIIAGSEGDPLG